MEWISYKDVMCRSKHFGDGLIAIGESPKSIVGIFALNRAEYPLVQFGCHYNSMILCPIYGTFGPNVSTFIINEGNTFFFATAMFVNNFHYYLKVNMRTIICDTLERVQSIISQVKLYKNLKKVIVLEDIPYSFKSKGNDSKC